MYVVVLYMLLHLYMYMYICTYVYVHIHVYMYICICLCCLAAQLCLTLCDPMGYSLSSSSVHGIFQARILVWVAISFSGDLYMCIH